MYKRYALLTASAAICAILSACAGQKAPIKAPPINLAPIPETAKIPASQPSNNWVVPVEGPESCQGKKGILMSEQKAVYLGKTKLAYDALYPWCQLERELWSGKWQISQKHLLEADRKIEDMKPGWWGRNKLELGFIGGVISGVGTAILIMYGIDKLRDNNR